MVGSFLSATVEAAPFLFIVFVGAPAQAAMEVGISRGWTREFIFPVYEWMMLGGAILGMAVYILGFTYIDQL